MSDIVFSEEVSTTDVRGNVVLIERESGKREWCWARDIPDANDADQHSAQEGK